MDENNEVINNEKNNENVENVDIENNDILATDIEEVVVEGNDTIKIANEAVATYAGIAVSEVSGVYGMTGTIAGITEAISGKKNLARGIKVDIDGKNAKIDVSIIVEYGARIPDVAFEIQSRVKNTVETMTGLKVSEVNVHVQGVHAASAKNEKQQERLEEKTEEKTENNELNSGEENHTENTEGTENTEE